MYILVISELNDIPGSNDDWYWAIVVNEWRCQCIEFLTDTE